MKTSMKVRDFYIKQVHRSEVKDFIEQYHYSKSINGVMWSYCFNLYTSGNELIGSMLYGYASWEEFHEKNNSIDGPKGLMRAKLSSHCVGHGPGTWDYMVGEYS